MAQGNVPTLDIKYAFRTRTGEIQGKPKKNNQDAYIISPDAVNGKLSMFSVLDGHGSCGHDVSGFIKSTLH